MSDSWDFYFTNVNGAPASIFVDLGICGEVPDAQRPWLLWVWVAFRHPRADGMYEAEEAPILDELEDALGKTLGERVSAQLVGRITTSGRREFYFYGPRPGGFEVAAASVMRNFPGYEFDAGVHEDPEWSQYFNVLFPTPEDMQCIQNLHVIQALEQHGDALSVPRPVSHWAYFPSEESRAAYIAQAILIGFESKDTSIREDDASANPYGVQLERIDAVDWESINDVTLSLFALAQEHGGDYDGWETLIVKCE